MVTRLVPKAKVARPKRRVWLLFFSDGDAGYSLTKLLTRRGFRHVAAASYFADEDRWVIVNPSRNHLIIEIRKPADAGEIYDGLLERAAAVLRFEAKDDERSYMPAMFCCVGFVKAILGIRSRALLPRGLWADLVRRGAEIIPLPDEVAREDEATGAAGRRSGSEEAA